MVSKIKGKLQIFLITYNRIAKLKATIAAILGENSPIRNCNITILDNKSTDGTTKFCDLICKKHKNVTHIVNNRNIGGNANIAKAIELANMQYFWILCDDDDYDFKYFDEVENAILKDEYDCIMVERWTNFAKDNIPYMVNELSFAPAGIYKTKNITDTVMLNAEANIMYSFPHLAIVCHLINIGAKFYVAKHPVIKQNFSGLEGNRSRGVDSENELHFRIKSANLFSGYINSYHMITDKKLRHKCCNELWLGKSFYFSMQAFFKSNGIYPYNICDVFFGVSFFQKVQVLLAFFKVFFPKLVLKPFRLLKRKLIK